MTKETQNAAAAKRENTCEESVKEKNMEKSEHSSAGEHRVYTAQVGGSNPSARTIRFYEE